MREKSKIAQKSSSWEILKIIIPVSFRATPLFSTLDIITMPLSPIWYVFATFVMQNLFDTIKNAAEGLASNREVITIIIMTIVVQILSQIINLITFLVSQPLKVKIKGALDKQIHDKTIRLKALSFEDADILDCITKAKQGADSALVFYASVSSLLFFYIPYIIAICIYLYHLRPLLLLSLLFIFIPLLIAQLVRGRVFGHLAEESAPLERKLEYYQKAIFHREYFKETRILGLFGFCNKLYKQTLALFNRKRWQADRRSGLIELFLRLLALSGFWGIIYLLFVSLMEGYISVGAFAAVFASMYQIIGEMEHAFGFYLSGLMEHMGAVKNYIQFLNLPEDAGKAIDTEPETSLIAQEAVLVAESTTKTAATAITAKKLSFCRGISLRNVSFRYPNTDKDAISHLNLDIQPGETLALVGENGAGKTTLVRLLMGIIPPTEGCILVNGKNLTDIAPTQRFSNTSGIFQNFRKYKLSLAENVAISMSESEVDLDKIRRVLHQADLSLDKRYTYGLETVLAREFDGIDLSGGEWQRISLARGLYRESELVVLDEPTSAIDPIEESKLYHKFTDIAANKTAIIVTHRLGSTKIADRIVVLESGHINAIGSHKQLLAENGLYAAMYQSQSKWYSD